MRLVLAHSNFKNVPIGAVTKSHKITEDIVEKAIGRWFRGGSDRNGGRQNRQ